MPDRFPKFLPLADHDALAKDYPGITPPWPGLRIRVGLLPHVRRFLEQIQDRGLADVVQLVGIETRDARWIVVDAQLSEEITAEQATAVNEVFFEARSSLADACEHCGRRGEIVFKVGMEVLLKDTTMALGDRFLCTPCAEAFQGDIA